MTDPEQDEVFEAYLKRRPVLPSLDDRPEPSAALDQKVMAAAREAIGPQRAGVDAAHGAAGGSGGMNRAPRWAVPIALAATILLSLSVVMNVSLNTNRPSPNRDRMADARADVKASAEANAIAESDAAAGVAARAKSPAMAFSKDERRESVSGGIPSNEVVLPGAKVAGVAAPRVPVEAEPAAPAPAPAAEAPEVVASAANRARAAPGAAQVTDALAQSEGTAAADSRVARAASAEDKAALFAKRAGANQPAAKSTAAAPHPTDPKVWLQQIDALRAAGKTEQAAAEMRRFKAAFPGYEVSPPPPAPPDLPK